MPVAPQGSSVGAADDGLGFVDGEVDFDDFEDFDDDDDDGLREMQEAVDVPGHEEWPEDNSLDGSRLHQLEAMANAEKDAASTSNRECATTFNTHTSVMTNSVTSKSKLSLKQQKSLKTRVCEVEKGGENQQVKKPPVASVKPIQQQFSQHERNQSMLPLSLTDQLSESELFEEPVLLRNLPEVERNSWKLQPFVKIKV